MRESVCFVNIAAELVVKLASLVAVCIFVFCFGQVCVFVRMSPTTSETLEREATP